MLVTPTISNTQLCYISGVGEWLCYNSCVVSSQIAGCNKLCQLCFDAVAFVVSDPKEVVVLLAPVRSHDGPGKGSVCGVGEEGRFCQTLIDTHCWSICLSCG